MLAHERQRPLPEEHPGLDRPEQRGPPFGAPPVVADHQKVDEQELHLGHRLVRCPLEVFPVREPKEAGRAAEGEPRQLVQL